MSSRLLRNALALFLGLILGGAATWASAVNGCFYHDVCHEDPNKAVQAFSGSFPQLIGPVMHLYWTTDIVVDCDFNYTTAAYDSNGQISFYPSASAFQSCVVPEDVSTLIPNNFILVCVVVLLWAIGFSVGQKR